MVVLSGCKCCQPGCSCPPEESLPSEVTVALSGITKSAVRVGGLLSLEFNSCFGSGASGTVLATAGGPATVGGPIRGVTLDAGGEDYAVRGRTAPTAIGLEAQFGDGSGAVFDISMEQIAPDNCGRPLWKIGSVKVLDGGSGYMPSQQLHATLGPDEYEHEGGMYYGITGPSEPTLEASLSPGEGAELSVTTKLVASSPSRWGVDKVTVESPGSGYYDGQPVTFSTQADATVDAEASARVEVQRFQPAVECVIGSMGAGAVLTAQLTKTTHQGRDVWEGSGITIQNGGAGYSTGQSVFVFGSEIGAVGDPNGVWSITADGNGAIVSLTSVVNGRFWKNGDSVSKVVVEAPGSYYESSGSITHVEGGGGKYYKQDETLPPLVAKVSVNVIQSPPSKGSGAVITAKVQSDLSRPFFGQIESIKLEDGGSGYLTNGYSVYDCPAGYLNGNSYVIPRLGPESCKYQGCYNNGQITVEYKGVYTPPTVTLSGACDVVFESKSAGTFPCKNLNFTASDVFGAQAKVTAGAAENAISLPYVLSADSYTVTIAASDVEREWVFEPSYPMLGPSCVSEFGGWYGLKVLFGSLNGTFSLQKQGGIYEYILPSVCGTQLILQLSINSDRLFLIGTVIGYEAINYAGTNRVQYSCADFGACESFGSGPGQYCEQYGNVTTYASLYTASLYSDCGYDIEAAWGKEMVTGGGRSSDESSRCEWPPCSVPPCEWRQDRSPPVAPPRIISITRG